MRWIPAISKRTMFISFILLFLLYLLYAVNTCLVDEKKVCKLGEITFIYLLMFLTKPVYCPFLLGTLFINLLQIYIQS